MDEVIRVRELLRLALENVRRRFEERRDVETVALSGDALIDRIRQRWDC